MHLITGFTDKLMNFFKNNLLLVVFCLFGMFWCALAALMIYEYSTLILPVGQKYTESLMAPKKNPCDTHFCAFGAECHVNNTIMKPYCRCIEKCDYIFSPVCGSDLVSYTNECNLKRESCLKKKRIKVLIAQQCGGYFKTSSTMIFRHCRRCWTTAKVRHFYKIRNRNRNLEVAVTVSRSIA
ncbi:agrin isoform X12 [Octopus vulgaris]|uniref:Agrin isoform X12 n=1 Tax=Octopus vulgaris TaxID=6645 RepID=A0AA36B057_OCTVU|nr:agrin isoform X12 [Octopus vulgaris]